MRRVKLERALKRGGIAEHSRDGDYRIWRCRNRQRRPLGVMKAADGDGLRADDKIELQRGEISIYVWAGPIETDVPMATLRPPIALSRVADRKAPRTLLARALEFAEDTREWTRLADAASRFMGDAERALQSGRVTMNWRDLALGRTGISAHALDNPPGFAGALAKARMGEVASVLSEDTMQLLDWVLVREMSANALNKRQGVKPERAVNKATHALRALAAAYDRQVGRAA